MTLFRQIRSVIPALLLLLLNGCTVEENNFVPYTKIDKYIPLINYNHLYVPGNSITFTTEGYAGLIVICVNEQQFYAFDACCPHEGTKLAYVETIPGQSGIVPSSNQLATCRICGSQYILFNGGYPIKGPSQRNLKQYQASLIGNRLWIHN